MSRGRQVLLAVLTGLALLLSFSTSAVTAVAAEPAAPCPLLPPLIPVPGCPPVVIPGAGDQEPPVSSPGPPPTTQPRPKPSTQPKPSTEPKPKPSASSAPKPKPSASSAPKPSGAPSPGASATPVPTPTPSPTPNEDETVRYSGGSLMDNLLGTAGVVVAPDGTRIPLDHFDIGNGAGKFDGPGRFTGWLTDWFFTEQTMAVGFVAWLVRWSFNFGLGELLAPAVTGMTRVWQSGLVTPLGLWGFVATIAGCWAALVMIRGRFTKGFGELVVSGVVAALAGLVLHDPGAALLGPDGLMGETRTASLQVAAVTVTGNIETGTAARDAATTDPADAVAPLVAKLTETFVVQPHQLLNWGRTFEPGSPCAKVYWELVKSGPHGRDGDPRDEMKKCGPDGEDAAEFNHDPSPQRLIATCIVGFAILLILLLVGVLAMAFLAAQVGMAFAGLRALPELLAAVLPGAGRSRLWRWLAAVMVAVATVIFAAAFLAVFLTIIGVVFTHTQTAPLLVRFLVVDIATLVGLVGWFKHRKAGRRAALTIAAMGNQSSVGGGAGARSAVAIKVPTLTERAGRAVQTVGNAAEPLAATAALAGAVYSMNPAAASAAASRLARRMRDSAD